MNEDSENEHVCCKICNKSLNCDFIDKTYCVWLSANGSSMRNESGEARGWAVGGEHTYRYVEKRDVENARIEVILAFSYIQMANKRAKIAA